MYQARRRQRRRMLRRSHAAKYVQFVNKMRAWTLSNVVHRFGFFTHGGEGAKKALDKSLRY